MKAVVTGAGGFIGGHLLARLARDRGADDRVIGVDIKPHDQWWQLPERSIHLRCDLRNPSTAALTAFEGADEVYHLACDMGGRGFIDTHEEACAMNAVLDLMVMKAARDAGVKRFFYASTACVYHVAWQSEKVKGAVIPLREEMVEAAGGLNPDGIYGMAKLYGEMACKVMEGLNTRVGRFHGVYGSHGSWNDGREKAPAALMRKVAEEAWQRHKTAMAGPVEVWGSGKQTRSFMHVDDAVEGTIRLMRSEDGRPMNLGSEESITMDEAVETIAGVAGFDKLEVRHVEGAVGVLNRTSDNTMIRESLGWAPKIDFEEGVRRTYPWIAQQVEKASAA